MTRQKPLSSSWAILALLLLVWPTVTLASTAFEQEAVKALAGRNVLLLVGPSETTAKQAELYASLVRQTGADPAAYPVYRTTRLPNETAGKLGLSRRGSNYAAIVKWGNPARFGPARVLESGVVNELSSDADLFVLVEGALSAGSDKSLLDKLPEELKALRPRAELVIERVDFEANGKPLFLVNTRVRIHNKGKLPAENVTVLFEVENSSDGSWYELGRHESLAIKPGNTITRDLVRSTHETPLLNEDKEILPTKYRIRVGHTDQWQESGGEFTPLLLEDQAER